MTKLVKTSVKSQFSEVTFCKNAPISISHRYSCLAQRVEQNSSANTTQICSMRNIWIFSKTTKFAHFNNLTMCLKMLRFQFFTDILDQRQKVEQNSSTNASQIWSMRNIQIFSKNLQIWPFLQFDYVSQNASISIF